MIWDSRVLSSQNKLLVLPEARQEKLCMLYIPKGKKTQGSLWLGGGVQDGGVEMEDGDVREVAKAAKGLSGSDLKEVCSQAQMRAVTDLLQEESERRARGEDWRGYTVREDGGVEIAEEVRRRFFFV